LCLEENLRIDHTTVDLAGEPLDLQSPAACLRRHPGAGGVDLSGDGELFDAIHDSLLDPLPRHAQFGRAPDLLGAGKFLLREPHGLGRRHQPQPQQQQSDDPADRQQVAVPPEPAEFRRRCLAPRFGPSVGVVQSV
jgi:hypothetical protein